MQITPNVCHHVNALFTFALSKRNMEFLLYRIDLQNLLLRYLVSISQYNFPV